MLCRCTVTRFKVAAPNELRGTGIPHRRRRFTAGASAASDHSGGVSSSTGGKPAAEPRPTRHAFIPPSRGGRGSPVGRALGSGERLSPTYEHFVNVSHTTSFSQRQRFRSQHTSADSHGIDTVASSAAAPPASHLTPLPASHGFYDGIDEHGLEPPRPSPALRQRMLQRALEEQAASVVEFTDGGEADIDLGGLPATAYHGQEGWTTIPRDSALYNGVIARDALESRQRLNSWAVARRGRPQQLQSMVKGVQDTEAGDVGTVTGGNVASIMGEYAAAERQRHRRAENADATYAANRSTSAVLHGAAVDRDAPSEEPPREVLDSARRRQHEDEGTYSSLLEGELLEPTQASVGAPRSVYGLRKLFLRGLAGYQGVISRAEEADIAQELLQLLQDPKAAYIAEEARYCVNLYESELGVPGRDTLAFAQSRAPTLQRVLYRLFLLGLVPALPNVVQVSEMVGTFSGYPVHMKPRAIGPYVGLLNLVSTTVMHMQHRDCPWYPRLHINPRSLFVFTEPCLSEYAMGYKWTHQPFHAFEYATRVSRDYRIEVLFACVETEHMRNLNEAVQLTEYANRRLASGSSRSSQVTSGNSGASASVSDSAGREGEGVVTAGTTDAFLERLRQRLHSGPGKDEHDDNGVFPGKHTSISGSVGSVSDTSTYDLRVVDGNALREKLLASGAIGSRAHAFSIRPLSTATTTTATTPSPPNPATSAARRRLVALKARYDFAKRMRAESVSKHPDSGPQLIRGHSPADLRGR